jgi:uncharacterized protein (TIGR03086 family)
VDLLDLDRRALEVSTDMVARVRADQLGRPTPCPEWTLEELLRHMVASNRGFTAAARGLTAGAPVWGSAELGDDPADTFRRSAEEVGTAFAAIAMPTQRIGVHGYGVFSAPVAISMHFVDFLVHAWDVAVAIGAPAALDAELSEAALAIALRWPYQRPDKAFGVRVPVPEDAPVDHRLLGYLGRSPAWGRKKAEA